MSVNNSLCLQLKQKLKVNLSQELPVNTGDTRDILLVADPLRQQPVPDLPGEHGGVLLLVLTDGIHYGRRGHLGFAAAYNSGFIVSGFIIPAVKKENVKNYNPSLVVEFSDCLEIKRSKESKKFWIR